MNNQIIARRLVSPVVAGVLMLAFATAGCNRGHNDNVQDNGPDRLPMRLELPRDDATEDLRIVQYAPDNVTRRVQQSFLKKGPYAGGRQLRSFDDDNALVAIVDYYAADPGQPEQLAYIATFSDGIYKSEKSYTSDGTRQTDGQRLPDGTFEQNSYLPDGKAIFKHAILGRVMTDDQKLVWKTFGDEVYREGGTVGAVQQLMDDGSVVAKFYDEHHFMTETLVVDKAGAAKSETDYAADGQTPTVRYDFADKTAYTFDARGQVVLARKYNWDSSQELTYFKDGVPSFTQSWEVVTKVDPSSTPGKPSYVLSWVKILRPDNSVSRQINYWTGTNVVQMVDITESPPADAKLNTVTFPPLSGSTTPAVNWAPPAKSSAGNKNSGSGATTGGGVGSVASAQAKPSAFWAPSGAHETYTYSNKGYLVKVESFKAGQWTADKTQVHKESEHVRAKVEPSLLKPMSEGTPLPDKPKIPLPTESSSNFNYDFN